MNVLDPSTDFGARATRRLNEEIIGWLTTVSPSGQPQPVPVWFLWDGDESILLYSRPDKPKLSNIERNPRVSLHLDGNGLGGDVVVVLGAGAISTTRRRTRCPEYVEKYGAGSRH